MDLSGVTENTVLNKLISHEKVLVNEKYKGTYKSNFQTCFLVATNSPVKITDSQSGLLPMCPDAESGRGQSESAFTFPRVRHT